MDISKNKMRIKSLIGLTILFIALGCEEIREEDENLYNEINCSKLEDGLINRDREKIGTEIDKLTKDLLPKPTPDDQTGQSKNLDLLTQRLNKNCENLAVTIFCYACIYTNPPQSELVIQLDSSGVRIERWIDIGTSSKHPLVFNGIH